MGKEETERVCMCVREREGKIEKKNKVNKKTQVNWHEKKKNERNSAT